MPTEFRSSAWFAGDDEIALEHRAAMHAAGFPVTAGDPKPIIGLISSISDLNPCNLPLQPMLDAARESIESAGGVAVQLPAMSLGEDLMKPTAMLYRNLLSMEVEEYIRSSPIDGVLLFGNCDKTVPGMLMGAVSANLPTLQITGGYRQPGRFRGQEVGAGTDLWKFWDERRAGKISSPEWKDLEAAMGCSAGACNVMGTAMTMSILAESLGMMIPGSSTLPVNDPRQLDVARESGRQILRLVDEQIVPRSVLTREAFNKSLEVIAAIGGSTNAVLHLTAIAGRAGISIDIDDFDRASQRVPVLADIAPIGRNHIAAFDEAGGLVQLRSQLEQTSTNRDDGRKEPIGSGGPHVIRSLNNPVAPAAFVVLHGNLAPDGALLKVAAATSSLLQHTGLAVVFDDYSEMLDRIDDPALEITPSSVLILRGYGPKGDDGFPEWGMIPIPSYLSSRGITDMVRISDARMSGTSFGTCVLHVAPDSSSGGPLSLVKTGDSVTLDVQNRKLSANVPEIVWQERQAARETHPSRHLRGWPRLYREHVLQSPEGADLDLLRPRNDAELAFQEPLIGRS